MDESSHCLESLINLIYLAKHSASDADAVVHYLSQAEEQAARLVAFHRRLTAKLHSLHPTDVPE